jgi:cytochrome c oxidase cbb3-type subunit 3
MAANPTQRASGQENYDPLMMVGVLLSLLLVIGLSLYWFGDTNRLAAAADDLQARRIQNGQQIYNEQCTACHGAEGEGGVGPALNSRQLLKNTPDEIFFSVIRSGVPNTQMPSWSVDFGGPLTDEDLHNVVALLRSWEPNAPEISQQAAQPDPAQGAVLFASTCAICHGENGMGGKPGIPALNDAERLHKLDDNWYRGVIANGRPAKGMPTWGTVLSPSQLDDLVALLAAWRSGEEVAPSFSVTELIQRALFALSQDDPSSARLHVSRAIEAAAGAGAAVLQNAAAQLEAGDLQGAQATLQELQAQWPLGDPASGALIYSANCGACHGVQGEGGIGKTLHPDPWIEEQSNAQLVEFVLKGRPGTAMAGFEGRLSETETADVVSFLRLWQK